MTAAPPEVRLDDLTELASFDLETTGIGFETVRVVSAYIGRVRRDGAVTGGRDWLINPGVPIPRETTAIHGISGARARRAGLPPKYALAEILSTLRDAAEAGVPLVAYNARGDITQLDREARRHGLDASFLATAPVIDPWIIGKKVDKRYGASRSLGAVCEHYGIPLENAHTADADAIATGRLAWAMIDQLPADIRTVDYLHQAQVRWAESQAENFVKYRRKKGDPVFTLPTEWPLVPPRAPLTLRERTAALHAAIALTSGGYEAHAVGRVRAELRPRAGGAPLRLTVDAFGVAQTTTP